MEEEYTLEQMMDMFLKNGLDISYFNFSRNQDKENFFLMYVDLFKSILRKDESFYHIINEDFNLLMY